MPLLKDVHETQTKIVAQMRAILDKAESESRDMSAEETAEYEKLEKDLDQCQELSDRAIAADKRAQKLRDAEDRLEEARQFPPVKRNKPDGAGAPRRTIFEDLALNMELGLSRTEAIAKALENYHQDDTARAKQRAWQDFLRAGQPAQNVPHLVERAALQMDQQSAGGTLVIPEDFIARLVIGLDEMVAIRGAATVLPMTSAASLGAPSLETDPDDADWTVELATGSLDTAMATGKRLLTPHPVAKRILVSDTLLRRSALPADSLVRSRLQFKMAVTQEKAFLTGSGAQRPLGLFTASAQGISTSRDYSTDNTTTAFTADGLIGAKYNLMSQYHMSPNLRWIFHRDGIAMARKLKDGNGQYLWQPGLAGDRPGTILDVPYIMSEFAPNTFTTGLYVGLIGDLTYYWIAESLSMTMKVLGELHYATNQIGYYIRAELDAMPVLEEAFTRVTLA